MDRNGLRPMRYTITKDGLLFAGSEPGMVRIDEQNIVEKGRLGPGQMLAVDLREGQLYHAREIKDYMASLQTFGEWIVHATPLAQLLHPDPAKPVRWECDELGHPTP